MYYADVTFSRANRDGSLDVPPTAGGHGGSQRLGELPIFMVMFDFIQLPAADGRDQRKGLRELNGCSRHTYAGLALAPWETSWTRSRRLMPFVVLQ